MNAVTRLYADYKPEQLGEITESCFDYFDLIAAQLGWAGQKRLFEVGFGGGRFLAWAQDRGHLVSGVEPLPQMVEAARAKGFDVHGGALTPEMTTGTFDAVCSFDVLEHMTLDEIVDTLSIARDMLKPDGVILTQFPNGCSPFSLFHQAADGTHKTVLSAQILEQIGRSLGMTARPLRVRPIPPGLKRGLRRRLSYLTRDLIEVAIGMAYFGGRRDLDPNAVVVLSRS